MSRKADQHTLVADALEQVGQHGQPVLPVQALGQGAVRGDADRLALRSLGDQLRLLVPIGLAQAQPV